MPCATGAGERSGRGAVRGRGVRALTDRSLLQGRRGRARAADAHRGEGRVPAARRGPRRALPGAALRAAAQPARAARRHAAVLARASRGASAARVGLRRAAGGGAGGARGASRFGQGAAWRTCTASAAHVGALESVLRVAGAARSRLARGDVRRRLRHVLARLRLRADGDLREDVTLRGSATVNRINVIDE